MERFERIEESLNEEILNLATAGVHSNYLNSFLMLSFVEPHCRSVAIVINV